MTRAAVLGRLQRLPAELGGNGLAALALLAATALVFALVVRPMQAQNDSLARELDKQARNAAPAQSAAPAAKLAAVYRFLEKDEATTDWLAKLYAIGKATGVELKSANYRTQSTGKVERYEIVLPLTGSYGQIRDFMKRALAEIPVLSLDQVTLKRDKTTDGVLQAEVRLSLHSVRK